MILRAWLEPNSAEPLRVQIRLTKDVNTSFTTEITLIDVASVSTAVEQWLTEVMAQSE